MFRQLLMGSARAVYAPENDEGADFEDEIDTVDEFDEGDDPDEFEEPDEPDEPEDVDDVDEPEPVRQPTRGERRVASATKIAAEAKAKVAQLEADLAALRTERSRPQGESQAQRQARLAEMEPWERSEYLTNERLARLEYEGNDRLDKLDFKATMREDPVAVKMEAEVERRLSAMRANGFNATRDVIYTQVLGERARANKGRATGKAQRTATANRERQQARPSNSRGDATTTETRRGDSAAARAKRLENMSF
jgi:hypothetical protein